MSKNIPFITYDDFSNYDLLVDLDMLKNNI